MLKINPLVAVLLLFFLTALAAFNEPMALKTESLAAATVGRDIR
jgi:hypothetical protein